MRLTTALAALLGAALAAGRPAAAFTIVPAAEDSGRIIVIIERTYGDLVPLKALPPPFNRIVQTIQGPEGLSFRWRYFRSSEEGICYIQVDPDGSGRMDFEFYGPELADGDALGAAAVLVDAKGRALHSFFARADVEGDEFAGGGRFHRISMKFERPPEWWQEVDAIAFFNMKYYRLQRPGDEGVWRAMHSAVERFTGGEGTMQQADGR